MAQDEAFGGRVYETIAGDFAVSIDTYFMTDVERAGLASIDAAWIEPVILESQR